MNQPPNLPEQDPQNQGQIPAQQPEGELPAGQSSPTGADGQPWTAPVAPVGADGQPWTGPVGPDGQPWTGPLGPDGQPWMGPLGPDGQPWTGPLGPDGQPWMGPLGPDGQPQMGAAEVRPENKFGVKQLLSALLVVAVLGAGAWFLWNNFQSDAALAEGNCLVLSGDMDDAKHEAVDCDDQSVFSQYVGEVIEGDGTCSDEFAAPYTIVETSRGGGKESTTKVTCLIPQLFEGACYNSSEGVNELEPADCASAEIKVTKVADETGIECAAGEEMLDYTKPARTYCVAFQE